MGRMQLNTELRAVCVLSLGPRLCTVWRGRWETGQRAEPACPAGRCTSLCSPRPCQAASMGVRWGKQGEIGYFCPGHKCRPPHQLSPVGPQPRLPQPLQQTLLQSQGHVLPFGFCSWGVSVSQPWLEFTCVPDHGLIPTGMDGSAACWVPALGVGIGTAGTPGLIEQKPPFGCHKVSEVLPHSSLTSPLSFCPFAGFGAMLLTCSPWPEQGDKYQG